MVFAECWGNLRALPQFRIRIFHWAVASAAVTWSTFHEQPPATAGLPNLYLRKLTLRKDKKLCQSHTPSTWGCQTQLVEIFSKWAYPLTNIHTVHTHWNSDNMLSILLDFILGSCDLTFSPCGLSLWNRILRGWLAQSQLFLLNSDFSSFIRWNDFKIKDKGSKMSHKHYIPHKCCKGTDTRHLSIL